MVQSEDVEERIEAVELLEKNWTVIPDKEQSWDDLILLIQDKSSAVRRRAVTIVGSIFPHVFEKEKAGEDLHRLIKGNSGDMLLIVADVLISAFPYIPDKKQAWDDLHRLTLENSGDLRWRAADVIGSVYPYIPNKKQAWDDINRLSRDMRSGVRWGAAEAIGLVYPIIPDKEQAWKDLHRMTQDMDKHVRWGAARAIGLAYPIIPDKEQAWKDLHRMTQDADKYVQAYANYSLGKISIFKATGTQNEDSFRKELENALEFFSLSRSTYINPARFCLPFYKSFYAITFKKEETEAEVQTYLAEAKRAVEGSMSKEKLLEAVENLANALKKAHKAMNFDEIKSDLNAYRHYCERAADILDETEDKAPGATKLIRRGLPIIDKRIRELITEIQENAKTLCKQIKDTPFENLGKEVIRVSQAFPQIRDPIGLEKGFINLWTALSTICAKMPEEERGEACELLKKASDEPYIEDKLPLISMVLSKISSQISAAKNIDTVEKKLDKIIVSLKPGIREELVISVGAEFSGTGAQHVITIPLQDISYPDLKKDLEKINGKSILKLSSLPAKLAEKVKSYLVRNKKDEIGKAQGLRLP
ncbi:MAG: HEAT repeat domain-containing protein [Candidatus Methanoperedens sp.]|nr:HEAT repeat domain-containing protein [Candidatus Methanoperedens sp.]